MYENRDIPVSKELDPVDQVIAIIDRSIPMRDRGKFIKAVHTRLVAFATQECEEAEKMLDERRQILDAIRNPDK